jgi:hypothetical protein
MDDRLRRRCRAALCACLAASFGWPAGAAEREAELPAAADLAAHEEKWARRFRVPENPAVRFTLAADAQPPFIMAGAVREEEFRSRDYAYTTEETEWGNCCCRNRRRRRAPRRPCNCRRRRTVFHSGTVYDQQYRVVFDLLAPDGAPRVPPEARSLTLTLEHRGQPVKVTFDLSRWQAAGLEHARR